MQLMKGKSNSAPFPKGEGIGWVGGEIRKQIPFQLCLVRYLPHEPFTQAFQPRLEKVNYSSNTRKSCLLSLQIKKKGSNECVFIYKKKK